MRKTIIFLMIFVINFMLLTGINKDYKVDKFKTTEGLLEIFFVGHGTLYFQFGNLIIHVDPFGRVGDYTQMPKADLIVITHEHSDHLDNTAIKNITKKGTIVVGTEKCSENAVISNIMKNGETKTFLGIKIEAVPAYNIIHKRQNNIPFHPKGIGNGYVFTFGDKRIYVAGDTENIPEMKNLKNIDIAFLPMNLPYTMSPEMTRDAVLSFRPGILYPYHFGNTDTSELIELLRKETSIEVRIRNMQ